ncbi:hypothetical protein B9T31_08715 [Acinetobacter sp. ANC 4558]|uniref:outer membrane protein n=1 Tax=Acinetobacter sp. ANC 4558 TaxID=1977876 RepID=UPI000A3412C8|nr:outer membrane beta-barrel protein [Acinetobacter sp. ANC 4558]OTG86112.1 hypothetical protein B9T31_08715 [Acinetobacter sp. ANC 4558]
MVNGYYDFKYTSKFTPYVSLGIGATGVKNSQTEISINDSVSSTDTHFTWSAGAGVAYNVTDNVALDLSHKINIYMSSVPPEPRLKWRMEGTR